MAKRESRAAQRERLLRAAAEVSVPASCDVVVAGGGAAGLVAAIVAAEAGASVVVLECDLECGRSILATGNGRCNFANAELDARRYSDPAFVEAVCGPAWLDDVLGFFRESGLRWCVEDGRLYPMSRQAASVRNVLLARARRAGVVLAPVRKVLDVHFGAEAGVDAGVAEGRAFAGVAVGYATPTAKPGTASIAARSLVLACGGMHQSPIAGIGLPTRKHAPVLCPLACRPSPLTALDGRRVHARASLTQAGASEVCWSERGEVLFRSYGLSGIVVFDASRRAGQGDLIELNLAPELGEDELLDLICPAGDGVSEAYADGSRAALRAGAFEPGCLDGVLDPAIASVLEGLARRRWHVDWPGQVAPASDAEALVRLVRALPFVVDGPAETERAQVLRGGLATEAFDPVTLAAYDQPSLFACGEALDIDADCGGFNLAWAWKSGMVAGAAAARRVATS